MDNANLYYSDYPGYSDMLWFDCQDNKLYRWFMNFKQKRDDSFCSDYECLIIEQVPRKIGRFTKKIYVGRLECNMTGLTRDVVFDVTAPEPPVLTFAARRQYEPPPPKTAAELRKEAEYERMRRKGYELRHRPVNRYSVDIGPATGKIPDNAVIEYEEYWVKPEPLYYGFDKGGIDKQALWVTPAPKRNYRRNN